jgi:hypothetical protein
MMWLTYLGADCCEDLMESCSIFLFDSWTMEQSLVRWMVLFLWYLQYRGLAL